MSRGGGPLEERWRGLLCSKSPSTMLRMVPLPCKCRGGLSQTAQRPARRFGHHFVLVLDEPLQDRRQLGEPAIPRGDRRVAHHPVPPDPLDRRAREDPAEAGIVELEKVGERGG